MHIAWVLPLLAETDIVGSMDLMLQIIGDAK